MNLTDSKPLNDAVLMPGICYLDTAPSSLSQAFPETLPIWNMLGSYLKDGSMYVGTQTGCIFVIWKSLNHRKLVRKERSVS